ncbi:MAG: endonuclease/exonuclease/phosphatase family protein [Boseongicola sp.]|nr:endonuclease/exonuclease/phosphatase family protein [Boseongicola sp.]
MDDFKLASWNVRKCVGLDRKRDPLRIVNGLNSLGADVVVLQEADRRLGRRPAALPQWMIDAETDYSAVSVARSEVSLGWHGNAVLLGPEARCVGVDVLDLPGLEPRGAVIADIERGTSSLRVVAVHLGLMTRSRVQQYHAIRESLAEMEARPTVILGDFNEWGNGRGFPGLPEFEVHAPGATFHASRPVAALDRVALSGELVLEDASVVETPLTKVASDHLPITARVRVAA